MNLYSRLMEKFASTKYGAKIALSLATKLDRKLIRWTKGRYTSGFGTKFSGNILLLTCKGRKSGKERVVPLLFTADGENVILVASRGGHTKNPAWYYNLKANPDCAVEIRGVRTQRKARIVEGEERARLWELCGQNYSGYDKYQARVDREIPVMLLELVGDLDLPALRPFPFAIAVGAITCAALGGMGCSSSSNQRPARRPYTGPAHGRHPGYGQPGYHRPPPGQQPPAQRPPPGQQPPTGNGYGGMWPPGWQPPAGMGFPPGMIPGGQPPQGGPPTAGPPATQGPPPPGPVPSGPRGSLPPATIKSVIRSRSSAYQQCYEAGVRLDHGLSVRVALRVVISANGQVYGRPTATGTPLTGSQAYAQSVANCVANNAAGLVFPPPNPTGYVVANYGMTFRRNGMLANVGTRRGAA